MEVDESICDVLTEIRKYSKAEVKILCIDAIMYYREHEGEDKIDINKFFELKGL